MQLLRRPGTYTVVSLPTTPSDLEGVVAVVREAEGTTLVCPVEMARARGWHGEFTGAWLTVETHTTLDMVGITAHISRVLAKAGIPCNVFAGYFHDHLLVPVDRADEASRLLRQPPRRINRRRVPPRSRSSRARRRH